jgi:hypothetical protein
MLKPNYSQPKLLHILGRTLVVLGAFNLAALVLGVIITLKSLGEVDMESQSRMVKATVDLDTMMGVVSLLLLFISGLWFILYSAVNHGGDGSKVRTEHSDAEGL